MTCNHGDSDVYVHPKTQKRSCRKCRKHAKRRERSGNVRPDRPDSVVYFLADEHGRVKIGHTRHATLPVRLGDHQIGNADALTLLTLIPGGWQRERALHHRFHHAHVRGEWFAITPDDIAAALA